MVLDPAHSMVLQAVQHLSEGHGKAKSMRHREGGYRPTGLTEEKGVVVLRGMVQLTEWEAQCSQHGMDHSGVKVSNVLKF